MSNRPDLAPPNELLLIIFSLVGAGKSFCYDKTELWLPLTRVCWRWREAIEPSIYRSLLLSDRKILKWAESSSKNLSHSSRLENNPHLRQYARSLEISIEGTPHPEHIYRIMDLLPCVRCVSVKLEHKEAYPPMMKNITMMEMEPRRQNVLQWWSGWVYCIDMHRGSNDTDLSTWTRTQRVCTDLSQPPMARCLHRGANFYSAGLLGWKKLIWNCYLNPSIMYTESSSCSQFIRWCCERLHLIKFDHMEEFLAFSHFHAWRNWMFGYPPALATLRIVRHR